MNFLAEYTPMSIGEGLIFALFAILIVFTVLGLIILITSGISMAVNLLVKKEDKKDVVVKKENVIRNTNIEDDDMMAAVLTASIDYQNEIKQDVRLVNVRRIK